MVLRHLDRWLDLRDWIPKQDEGNQAWIRRNGSVDLAQLFSRFRHRGSAQLERIRLDWLGRNRLYLPSVAKWIPLFDCGAGMKMVL